MKNTVGLLQHILFSITIQSTIRLDICCSDTRRLSHIVFRMRLRMPASLKHKHMISVYNAFKENNRILSASLSSESVCSDQSVQRWTPAALWLSASFPQSPSISASVLLVNCNAGGTKGGRAGCVQERCYKRRLVLSVYVRVSESMCAGALTGNDKLTFHPTLIESEINRRDRIWLSRRGTCGKKPTEPFLSCIFSPARSPSLMNKRKQTEGRSLFFLLNW